MTKNADPNVIAELSVRVARAEIERDQAKQQLQMLWSSESAIRSRDPEKMLDSIHLMGIPARDVKHMYEIETTWRREGGNQTMLDWWRDYTRGKK